MGRTSAAKTKARPSASGSASSSGTSTPAPPSTPSTPERVGKYNMSHLPKAWDDDDFIRERLREDKPLLLHLDPKCGQEQAAYVEGTVDNVKLNLPALLPLADLMSKNSLLMPNIDSLIQSVHNAYKVAKKPRNYEHCYAMGWAFRRLLGTGKSFCYRDHPPEDSKLAIILLFFDLSCSLPFLVGSNVNCIYKALAGFMRHDCTGP